MGTGLHARLWQENADLANACLNHAFVQGLGDGSLDHRAFRRYIAQDAFFLVAFARGYAMCAAACEQMADFRIFHRLQSGVLDELEIHAAYAASLDIDLDAVRPFAETAAYTEFLLTTGASRPLGETVAAMTPCMRLYAFLGQRLAVGGIPRHAYAEWVRAYCSDEFEALASSLENALDRFVENEGDAAAAYRRAMQCELDFFSAPLQTRRQG